MTSIQSKATWDLPTVSPSNLSDNLFFAMNSLNIPKLCYENDKNDVKCLKIWQLESQLKADEFEAKQKEHKLKEIILDLEMQLEIWKEQNCNNSGVWNSVLSNLLIFMTSISILLKHIHL